VGREARSWLVRNLLTVETDADGVGTIRWLTSSALLPEGGVEVLVGVAHGSSVCWSCAVDDYPVRNDAISLPLAELLLFLKTGDFLR
jgi:hypothetical protein